MKSFNEIINSTKPVLIDFYTEWCGPCKLMSPVLKQVKVELGDAISIIKINVDNNQSLAQKQNVRGVPTFMIYKNGLQLWRQSGIISKDELIKILSYET